MQSGFIIVVSWQEIFNAKTNDYKIASTQAVKQSIYKQCIMINISFYIIKGG